VAERELPLKNKMGKEKDTCPICGHQFDEVEEENVCPTYHYGEQTFKPEDLITDDDDYLWCY
jgi:hypothetical protein